MALTDAPGYGVVAKILHWLIFTLLAVQYAIGSIMPHIGRKTLDDGWVSWHFSVGAAILFFIVIRLMWRLFHPVPQLPTLEPWEKLVSGITHWALYLLVLAMTVLGWAATNSRGWDCEAFRPCDLAPACAQGIKVGPRMRRHPQYSSLCAARLHRSACGGGALSPFRQARPRRRPHAAALMSAVGSKRTWTMLT